MKGTYDFATRRGRVTRKGQPGFRALYSEIPLASNSHETHRLDITTSTYVTLLRLHYVSAHSYFLSRSFLGWSYSRYLCRIKYIHRKHGITLVSSINSPFTFKLCLHPPRLRSINARYYRRSHTRLMPKMLQWIATRVSDDH